MSESGYQVIDLDNLGSPTNSTPDLGSDIEIVDETVQPEAPAPEPTPAPVARPAPEPESEDDDESDGEASGEAERKKPPSRSQRLKNQRDEYARRLAAAEARIAEAEARATRYERDAQEGAAIGFELLVNKYDADMQALRHEFDTAYEAGDRSKIFEVQQKMSALAAEKAQAERDRRLIPTKPVQKDTGPEAPPQTQQTRPQQAKPLPPPAAMDWYERNKSWFNQDPIMSAAARIIDQNMAGEGYSPDDPNYFDELDRRIQREFPHKFTKAAPTKQSNNPTIQNKTAPAATPGKIRVTITAADREMANHLGVSVEQYAREKAKVEQAARTTNQYTEIL